MTRLFYSIKKYFRQVDKLLLFLVTFASIYGVVLIYSAMHNMQSNQVNIQIGAIVLGLVMATIISLIDYESISKLWPFFSVMVVLLMIYTLIFGVGPEGSNNKAWIMVKLNSFKTSIQPSEFLKIAFILTFSRHLHLVKEDINRLKNVAMLALHAAFPLALVLLTKDDGSATVFIAITICMLLIAGLSLKYFAVGGLAAAIATPLIWFFYFDKFQRERFLVVFNPDKYDPTGLDKYYQQLQGKIAIGSGRFLGRGLFSGPRTQNSLVPKSHNDFILTVAGEELGFVGVCLIFILLLAIFIRILVVAKRTHFTMGKIICVGIFAQFVFQSVLNIGMCLSILPVIGVTLPFFSQGGSSVLTSFVSIGIILSIYIHNEKRPAYDDGLR